MNIDREREVIELSEDQAAQLRVSRTFPFADAPALLTRIKQVKQAMAENPPSTSSPVFSERNTAFRAHATMLDNLMIMAQVVEPIAAEQMNIAEGQADIEEFLRDQSS